jgi:hypothetical protein
MTGPVSSNSSTLPEDLMSNLRGHLEGTLDLVEVVVGSHDRRAVHHG